MNDDQSPLRTLNDGAVPPAHLKARVTATLHRRGLLRGRPWRWQPLWLAAAALVLFVSGIATGRSSGGAAPAPDARPAYALLLYEDASFRRDRPEAEMVAEYRAWASDLSQRGVLVSGEKLDSTAQVLGLPGDGDDGRGSGAGALGQLAGFFIIHAASETEALSIARSCPHLNHGGRIALRPIVPT